jgi:hypothetical protein
MYVAYPDKFRVDADIAGDKTTQVYAGGRGWLRSPKGVQDPAPAQLADMASSVRRDTFPLLIGAAEGRYNVRTAPDQKGRNGAMMKVLEISGIDLQPVRLYIDDQMLIAGQAYSTAVAPNRRVLTEELFSDYRPVNGIRIPFEAQLLQNGQPVMKRTFRTLAFNEAIPDSTFQRPQ